MSVYNKFVSLVEKMEDDSDGDDHGRRIEETAPVDNANMPHSSISGTGGDDDDEDDWGLYGEDEEEEGDGGVDQSVTRQLKMDGLVSREPSTGHKSSSSSHSQKREEHTSTGTVATPSLNVQDFYNVDVSKLTPEQLEALRKADEDIDRGFAEKQQQLSSGISSPTTNQYEGTGVAANTSSAVVENNRSRPSTSATTALSSPSPFRRNPTAPATSGRVDVSSFDVSAIQQREAALLDTIRKVVAETTCSSSQQGATGGEEQQEGSTLFMAAMAELASLSGKSQCEAEVRGVQIKLLEEKLHEMEDTCRGQGELLARVHSVWDECRAATTPNNVDTDDDNNFNDQKDAASSSRHHHNELHREVQEQLHYLHDAGVMSPSAPPTQADLDSQQLALRRTQEVLHVHSETITTLERTNVALRSQLLRLEATRESEQHTLQQEVEKASFDALRYSETLLDIESRKSELQRVSNKVTSLNQLLDAKNKEVGGLKQQLDSALTSLQKKDQELHYLMGGDQHTAGGEAGTAVVNIPSGTGVVGPPNGGGSSAFSAVVPPRGLIQTTKVYRSIPNEKWWGKTLQKGITTMDSSSMKAGRFLRQNAAVRLAFVAYIIVVHLYMFYLSTLGMHTLPAAGHDVHDHIENHLHAK